VIRARRLLRRIAARMAFLADLAHRVEVIADDNVAAAAIDTTALRIALCPSWCSELSDDDLEYVLTHELLHVFLRTGPRGRGVDAVYWNFAHDLVINQRLSELLGRPAPRGGVTLDAGERIDAETALLRGRAGRYRSELRRWIAGAAQVDVHDAASPALGNARVGQHGVSLGRGGDCVSYTAVEYEAAHAAEPCAAVIDIESVRPWPTSWVACLRAGGAVRGRSWLRPSRRQLDDTPMAGRYRVTGDVTAIVDVTPAMLPHARRLLGQLRAFIEDLAVPELRLICVDELGIAADARLASWRGFRLPRVLVNQRTDGAIHRDGLWICSGCALPHAAPRPHDGGPAFAAIGASLRSTAIVITAPRLI
jgi:hypothetical protein